MKWWLSVMIAMLVWGNAAFATLPTDSQSRQDQNTISSWMAHLNQYFPGLSVTADAELLSTPQSRAQVLKELELLEGYMHGDYTMPSGALQDLACDRPACGSGGSGNCKTCMLDDREL
jgi:hypothetical protein